MQTQQTIKCAFCKGTGKNPHYGGTCPVCKGKGKNQVTGRYMACGDCHGSGQKSGTTLTCYTCAGLGVVPDTRQELRQARQEIRKIQEEMEEERTELTGRPPKVRTPWGVVLSEVEGTPPTVKEMKRRKRKQQIKEKTDEFDKIFAGREASAGRYFCQSCAKEESLGSAYKVCEKCFFLYKFGEVREIKPEKAERQENEG